MSRRSKISVWSLLTLLVGLAAWGAVQRSRQSAWVAELQRQGVRVTTEQAYECHSSSLAELCWSVYSGQSVRVMIDNESDARALLGLGASCPTQLQILTFLDLSADWFSQLQDRFPAADLVALVPEELFVDENAVVLPPQQVSGVGNSGSATTI